MRRTHLLPSNPEPCLAVERHWSLGQDNTATTPSSIPKKGKRTDLLREVEMDLMMDDSTRKVDSMARWKALRTS